MKQRKKDGLISMVSLSQSFPLLSLLYSVSTASLPIPFGTHHSKLSLFEDDDMTLHVIVSTANLLQGKIRNSLFCPSIRFIRLPYCSYLRCCRFR